LGRYFFLLNNLKDINIGLDTIVNYLIPYYNPINAYVKEVRVKNTPELFISTFKNILKQNKKKLLVDKRSIGAEWCILTNQGLGLWRGIINNLAIIKQRGGPDLIPS
jgi:hypothetical protein